MPMTYNERMESIHKAIIAWLDADGVCMPFDEAADLYFDESLPHENADRLDYGDWLCGKRDPAIEEEILDDDYDPERGFLEDLSAAFPEI